MIIWKLLTNKTMRTWSLQASCQLSPKRSATSCNFRLRRRHLLPKPLRRMEAKTRDKKREKWLWAHPRWNQWQALIWTIIQEDFSQDLLEEWNNQILPWSQTLKCLLLLTTCPRSFYSRATATTREVSSDLATVKNQMPNNSEATI